MSEAAIGALVGGGFALLATVANLFYNYVSRRAEHKEQYRFSLYPKRLEVHQHAFRFLEDLFVPMAAAQKSPGADPGLLAELKVMSDDARRWWNANCLYLDDDSRERTTNFIQLAHEMSHGIVPDLGDLLLEFHRTLQAVQEGIGAKHLDIRNTEAIVDAA